MEEFCGSEFWNISLTWETEYPDLTPCFQQTVLVYLPCIFLVIFTPLELYYILNSKYSSIPTSFLNVSKSILSAALIVLTIIDLIYAAVLYGDVDNVYAVNYVTPIIKLIAFILSAILGHFNKNRGIMSSGTQFTFWLLLCILAIPQFRWEIQNYQNQQDQLLPDDQASWSYYKFCSFMIFFPLTIIQLLLHCFADKLPKYSKYTQTNISTKSTNPSLELTSSFLSKIFFIWFEPTTWKGFRKPLTTEDMYDLNPENTSYELLPLLDKYWKENVEKQRRNHEEEMRKTGNIKASTAKGINGSMMPAMIKAFGPPFWFAGVIKLAIDLLAFTTPFILGLLIDFTKDTEAPMWQGFFWMALMCLVTTLTAVLNGQFLLKSFLIGFRIKSSLISAIYRKALTISSKAKRDTTVGEIVNLMAVDAQRFVEAVQYFHLIWAAPLTIALAIYFLWQIIGVAVITGLVFMLLMIPFNGWLATRMRYLQVEQMKKKDDRVKLMNEILNGIKVLKLYAWEPSFENYIENVRAKELKTIKQTAYLNAITFILWTLSPYLVTLLSFATYVLIDENNVIDANTAFVSLTLFNIMRLPLIIFPMAISSAMQCWVAINRIDKFLNSEDIVEEDVTHNDDNKNAIKIENANFSWGDGEIALRNVNLSIEKGTLAAVVGTVGSGKSTLISSILGETEKLTGNVNTFGSIAYVPQQAWMQNATLRENIIFGKEFEQKFYDRVLETCALLPDIEMLPGGDETEIGEKGINLSGGQKQRISLARAVYSRAELYLFDDPLSAVDSHVGKHIFEQVIGPNGILNGKTRLLVTHGITYLPQVATIHVMTNGEITESGPYNQLIEEKGAFASFIEQHLQEMDEDDEEIKEIQSVLEDNKIGAKIFNRAISTRSSNERLVSEKKRFSRQESKISHQSAVAEKSEQNTKLIIKETEGTGSVKWEVYVQYLNGIGATMVAIAIITNITYQAFSVYSNTWLSEWSEDEESILPHKRDMYLGVYGALGVLQTVSVFGTAIAVAIGCVNAARDLHNNLLRQTMRLPMSFFDTTPLGRIVNRFAKDVDVVDNIMPQTLRFATSMIFSVISVIVVISISTPIFLAVILPMGIIYYFIQAFFVATSRQLKRIESVTRSPIYSHFSETITGQSTIRAYGAQKRFIDDSDKRVDSNQKCAYPSMVISTRWLNVRLELIGTLILLFAILFAILSKDTITGGTIGLSISYALQITQLLSYLVRGTAEIETNIVANERLAEYNHLPKEAEWITKPINKEWPTAGKIIFENYKLRYRDGLDLVLKGISFTAEASERIGIVGRTGAGKSSLTLALFRIIEPAGGSIKIDGLDISDMGLHSLRSRLTIIPQDPVLFSGTIRMNIDPLMVYPDDVIWTTLEHSHLKAFIKSTPNGLNHYVSEGGDNLSVGQRQLICLARALLRKTKVLILDEATAAVDLETDSLIQKTIREQFKDCTVLTIAHRLNTIMDSDKVLVLDQGRVAEFDSPRNLLNNRQTVFYGMAKDAGIVSSYTFSEEKDE